VLVRRLCAVVTSVVLLVLAVAGGSLARADGDAARILDRTYTCAVFFRGGAYLVDAHAHAGTRLNGAWARLPYAGVRTGVFSGGSGNLLAWITSGTPTATTMIDQDYDAFPAKTFGTVGVRRAECRQTSTPVVLTPAGLSGGPAPPLGQRIECFVPKQVVVRVRGVLQGDGSLRAGQDYLAAHVPVREAKLAVRTLTGKPLVYADVREDGKTRLFTARGCSPR
jgi:hypothetical protein